MAISIPVPFAPGVILDRDSVVWATLPPGTGLVRSRILGTCSVDPLELVLEQVTVDRDHWRLDLLMPGQSASFPLDRGFSLAVPDPEQYDERAWWSTAAAPIRVTARVFRLNGGATRDENGRLLRMPEPITFQLVLLSSADHGESA